VKRPEGFDPRPKEEQAAEPQAQHTSASDKAARDKPKRERQPRAQRPAAAAPLIAKPPRQAREQRAASVSKKALRTQARANARAEKAETRRFTRHSRRRRITWITIGAIAVVLVAVLAVAVFSPILALRTIRVEGATTVKASAVKSALDDQLGTPLALLDTTRIDHDLSQFTLIRSYVTEIVPPNTLVVRIVERQAIAAMPDGASFDLVDPAGVVLKTAATRSGLPIIDIGTEKLGSAAFSAAVKVLLALPASVSGKVQSISATTLDNVSLTLTGDKHTVVWGSADNSDEKAQTLAALLRISKCRSLTVINVTAPLAAACGHGQPAPPSTSTPTPTSTPGA
jgi:cell division protein FtsQ